MRILGMLSGTSVDAIDLAVVDFEQADGTVEATLVWHGEWPWESRLRDDILDVLPPASSDVGTWCRLDAEIGQAFGAAAAATIAEHGPVDLIASHGQTLHHWVEDGKARGSLQVGNPAWIHAATDAPVIADFRSADIAAGGQGAPLTCTLDELWLGEEPTAVLNLGGIANVTIVGGGGVQAGDTGPANCLLDAAARAHDGRPADLDGALALAGTVDEAALRQLMSDPWFALPLPKSTGREYFHAGYVAERLGPSMPAGPNLFATLTEFTAATVADVVNAHEVSRVVVSGGGANNPALRQRLEDRLDAPLLRSDELGMPAAAKEAVLFALLGWLSAHGLPGVVEGEAGLRTTGAERAVVLGTRTPVAPYHPAAMVRRLRISKEAS